MKVSKYINPNIIQDGSIEGDKKIKDYPPLSKGSWDTSVEQESCWAAAQYSHAEGFHTTTNGYAAHAEGTDTKTFNQGEHAEGRYNLSIKNKTIHTVGIGVTKRKNAEEIQLNGDKYVIGIGGYDGTNSQTEGIKTVQEVVAESANAVQITYTELKALRDTGKLVPGTQYRITDYTCTTTQENTKSAEHQFDIIVTADDESILNEVTRAIKHEGDKYFDGCNLNAWKLWYSLDNDTTRFAWADETDGKGVIYRMIDEWNNDIPYDFKNIQFKHPKNTTAYPYYYYTFASDNVEDNTDNSLAASNNVYSNKILPYIYSEKQTINKIVFIGLKCYLNSFGDNCFSNSFGNICNYNTFCNSCYNNSFGDNCYYNTFGNYCYSNSFGDSCYGNSFCNSGYSNLFGNSCNFNSFGNNCSSNSFGNNCSSNSFGNNCSSNTFTDYCSSNSFSNNNHSNSFSTYSSFNSFGDGCSSNSFKINCNRNSLGNSCNNNIFENGCSNNAFGNSCTDNAFGNNCTDNALGNDCSNNTVGNNCYSNAFGNSCRYIRFVPDKISAIKYNYYQCNHFGDGCAFLLFKGTDTASNSQQVQNYNFAQGLQGTSSVYLTIDGVRNRSFETKVAKKSNGELKIYCEADLIL